MKKVFLALSLAAVAAAFVGCQGGDKGGSTAATGGSSSSSTANLPSEVTLRLKANEGDKYTMVTTLETSMEAAGKTESMTLTSTEETTATKVEDGKVTWESKTTDVQATGTGPLQGMADMAKQQQMGKTQSKVRDDRNRIVGASDDEPLALIYPEKPVKPGDSWSEETTLSGQKVKVEFKLDRFEVVNGKTAAVLTANITGSEQIKATAPLTVYVDTANGWPLRGDGTFEVNAGGQKATMKVKMDTK